MSAVQKAAAQFGGMTIGNDGGKGGRKGRKYDLGSTNIAGMGTDLEKAIRQAAAECEDEWKKAGKEPGLQVWRIEKFKVVPWPKDKYGRFYSGDSYIILNTFKTSNGSLAWDAHFWIGATSTEDEYGTAAYKTAELDDYLGGLPTQFREVQGNESRKFRKLFKKLVFMEGGIDSGFTHVEEKTYRKRLLHCKGKKNVVVKEVPISHKSLNSGDSFILDDGLKIFVWHGKEAGPMEKAKAMNLAQALCDERGGQPSREVFEEGQGNDKDWWHAVGGKGPIKSAAEGGADDEVEVGEKRLLRLSDSTGRLKLQEMASGPNIMREMLDSDDVFILDDGFEVMVWVGKRASIAERKNALNFAVEYLKQYQRALNTPISRIMEGAENEVFEAAFEIGTAGMSASDVKFATSLAQFGGNAKKVAKSATPGYAGSGGPGTAADLDAIYAQKGADPSAWQGRSSAESSYAKELQAAQAGAYSSESGWVSGMSVHDREQKSKRIADLEALHAAGYYGARGESGTGARIGKPDNWRPTIVPYANFDADEDCEALRKAMKGLGTNEKTIINILTTRTQAQRNEIRTRYGNKFDRDLIKDFHSETGGNFRRTIISLIHTAEERDALFIHDAIKGLGTDDRLLIEILATKSSEYIAKLRDVYTEETGSVLTQDIHNDTSGNYRKALMALLDCKRQSDSTTTDDDKVQEDARALYDAGEKRLGTKESTFIEIFTKRSFAHLAATFMQYSKICKFDIMESIGREMGGNLKVLLQTIVHVVRDPTEYYTERIHESMKGAGTHHHSLISLLIERSEVDMQAIKELFEEKYGESLASMIRGETAIMGDYKRTLLGIIKGESDK